MSPNHYDSIRESERSQNQNDRRIHKHFIGSLKPKDKQIIKKLKEDYKI